MRALFWGGICSQHPPPSKNKNKSTCQKQHSSSQIVSVSKVFTQYEMGVHIITLRWRFPFLGKNSLFGRVVSTPNNVSKVWIICSWDVFFGCRLRILLEILPILWARMFWKMTFYAHFKHYWVNWLWPLCYGNKIIFYGLKFVVYEGRNNWRGSYFGSYGTDTFGTNGSLHLVILKKGTHNQKKSANRKIVSTSFCRKFSCSNEIKF